MLVWWHSLDGALSASIAGCGPLRLQWRLIKVACFVVSMFYVSVSLHIFQQLCVKGSRSQTFKPSTQSQPLICETGLRVKHHRVIVAFQMFPTAPTIFASNKLDPNCCRRIYIQHTFPKRHFFSFCNTEIIEKLFVSRLVCNKIGAERMCKVITQCLIKQIYSNFLYITFSYKTIYNTFTMHAAPCLYNTGVDRIQ